MRRLDYDAEDYSDDGRRFPAVLVWIMLGAIMAGLMLFLAAAGCTAVSGGEATRKASAVRVEVKPDGGVIVEDNTNRASTTQPMASGLLRSVGVGAGSADTLGGIEVIGGMKTSVTGILVGLGMIAVGFVLLKFFGQPVLGIGAMALGIAAVFVPTAVGVAALIVAGGVLLYFSWDSFKRVVRGVEAVKLTSNGNAEQIKLMLQAHASPATEAAVKAAK